MSNGDERAIIGLLWKLIGVVMVAWQLAIVTTYECTKTKNEGFQRNNGLSVTFEHQSCTITKPTLPEDVV